MENMPIGISCKGGKKKELGVCKNFQEDTHKKKKSAGNSFTQYFKWKHESI